MGKWVDSAEVHEGELLRKMRVVFNHVRDKIQADDPETQITFAEFVGSFDENDTLTRRYMEFLVMEKCCKKKVDASSPDVAGASTTEPSLRSRVPMLRQRGDPFSTGRSLLASAVGRAMLALERAAGTSRRGRASSSLQQRRSNASANAVLGAMTRSSPIAISIQHPPPRNSSGHEPTPRRTISHGVHRFLRPSSHRASRLQTENPATVESTATTESSPSSPASTTDLTTNVFSLPFDNLPALESALLGFHYS